MNSEVETLTNEMMVKSRIYIKAITSRDEALVATCQSDSKAAEATWKAASEAAAIAHHEYYEAIRLLHEARKKG